MLETNPKLVEFILEARKKGYEDYQIRIPLLEKGWELNDVDGAFYEVKKQEARKLKKKQTQNNKTIYVYKNSLTVHLSEEVYNAVAKRAKKNMLTISEQVEDIVRRSCVNTKKNGEIKDRVDDLFLKLFSRKNSGRKKRASRV